MSIKKNFYGKTKAGEDVYEYTLQNKNGASMKVITYGATVTSISIPDKNGVFADVVCGYDTIEDYEACTEYHGSLVGRYANRIGKGRFTLNGKEYRLATNNGANHLHGGNVGFNRKVWQAEAEECEGCDKLYLTMFSPDGEENYPGNLTLNVTYTFDDDGVFAIDYDATCDADTVCNFTNHAYYNFGGYDGEDIKGHFARVNADMITVTDDELIPTGELLDVTGTMYDLRTEKALDAEYDDNFILGDAGKMKLAARVRDGKSGRGVEVYTDQPGIQIYTGNFMATGPDFKGGVAPKKHHALCLETQLWPDSPNHDNFTDCILRADEHFSSRTEYHFFAE